MIFDITLSLALFGDEPFGDANDLPVSINSGEHRSACGQQFVVAPDFVAMLDFHARGLLDESSHCNQIVVFRRPLVGTFRLVDNKKAARFLKIAVGLAQRTKCLGARHLEPRQVIRVIHHTHLIRLMVANANLIIKMKKCHEFMMQICYDPGLVPVDSGG